MPKRNGVRLYARNTAFNAGLATLRAIQRRRSRNGKRMLARNFAQVPMRRGFGRRIANARQRPVPRVQTNTIAPLTTNTISNLQKSAAIVINGTESMPNQIAINNDQLGGFFIIGTQSLNPAEPGLFPSLAATVNQYQRFKTGSISILWTPASAAERAGNLYIAVVPDPQQPLPTTLPEMAGLLGMQVLPLYGKSMTKDVDLTCLQQAYNVQQVKVPYTLDDDQAINSAGLLILAVSGVETTGIIGTMLFSYSWACDVKQTTTGANSLHGSYILTGGANPYVDPDDTQLDEGFHMWLTTTTAGVFRRRLCQAPWHVSLRETFVGAVPSAALSVASDAAGPWTLVPALSELLVPLAVLSEGMHTWRVPAGPEYIKIDLGGAITGGVLSTASTRNLVQH